MGVTNLAGVKLPKVAGYKCQAIPDLKGETHSPFAQAATALTYIGLQVISTRTGISFLMGTVRNNGRSILKSEQVAGIVPIMRTFLPCVTRWKGT